MINDLLTGSRIKLRALEDADLEFLYRWENDTSIWDVSETLSPVSKYILKKYLENIHKDIYETKQLRLMIQLIKEDMPIGTIDLYDFDPLHRRSAVGILIAEKDERKKGYASEALSILILYCREVLKLHQLYCNISSDNKSSLELFQQSGFEISGNRKDWKWDGKKFMDEHFLQCLL
jgi:diamine N-acetyltransferase